MELANVQALTFDIIDAQACGMRGAYINRYGLPYEDTPYQPDVVVANFTELADVLVG